MEEEEKEPTSRGEAPLIQGRLRCSSCRDDDMDDFIIVMIGMTS